jgi:hypothetical protein
LFLVVIEPDRPPSLPPSLPLLLLVVLQIALRVKWCSVVVYDLK